MVTSFSKERIAVHLTEPRHNKYGIRAILLFCAAAVVAPPSQADGLADQIKAPWSLLVFVSTSMPRQQVVSLARQAVLTRATLVLAGFPKWDPTPAGARAWVAQINDECCKDRGASWMVDPKLFKSYSVLQVPAFVLTKGGEPSPASFSKVSGDMDIGNALKFFNQESRLEPIRIEAERRYNHSFGGVY